MLEFFQGFVIGISLIVAIGPQNLFVINQGLKKKYILTVVLFCSISDSLLILLGINLSSIIVGLNQKIIIILQIIGGIWLTLYGINKIYKINNQKNVDQKYWDNDGFYKILATLFFITYINPHVYLDTIILIGSISANFENKFLFGSGVISSSFFFFFSLGYLSKYLSKYIYSNKTWFWIDLIIGTLMIFYGLYFIFY